MLMTATEAAQWCGGRRWGGDPILTGVCIDSRQARGGDLFVALPGAHTDGHQFITAAAGSGAVAAMVSESSINNAGVARIVVGDCGEALRRLAATWRLRFTGTLIAITGSNGKTTVKEMLASICRAAAGEAQVHHSSGNFNNRLGVPLSLLGLRVRHHLAVLEAGMDAPGELRELGRLLRPQVVVINNVMRAHLGGFNSLAEIAAAKGELLESLPANGTAILNADDVHLPLWKKLAGARRVLTFGFGDAADYRGTWQNGVLHLPTGEAVTLQTAGAHNANNALAAAAAATALNLLPPSIIAGLAEFEGVVGRLQFIQCGNWLIIDDSYNANPDSVLAALAVLAAQAGEKIAILGDMLDLGTAAADAHRQVLAAATDAAIEVFSVGEHFGRAGSAQHFADKEALLKSLRSRLGGRTATLLVKGSRGMGMETIARALTAAEGHA